MYSGTIEGEYIKLETNALIEMKWRFKDWDSYSHVVLKFEDNDDVRVYYESFNRKS